VCGTAGFDELPLKINWTINNPKLVKSMQRKAAGRKIVLVHGGRNPMGRTDGFGADLLPDGKAFNCALDALDDCFLIRIGKGRQIYSIKSHIDLNDTTTVSDMFDIASVCDGIVPQCSFAVPLAECFDKPLLVVWSARGLESGHAYINTITPKKILSKPTSQFVMDDWAEEKIKEVVGAFRKF
jgi:hypothetical protein